MANNNTWDQLLGITQAKLAGNAPVERRKLALGQLSPNADQPRKFFESRALTDLVASVKQHGILQPIVVRPHPADAGRFQIVAGERRWLAAQQAGLAEVPVVVRELDDQQALEIGLVENVLREDITPLEEARALQRLIDAFGYSYAKLGERLGKNKAYVDHRVRLLKMPAELQDALDRGVAEGEEARVRRPFTPRHAGVVVQIEDPAARAALIEAVFAEGLSVQQLQERARPRPAAAADGPLAGSSFHGAYGWAAWFYRTMVRDEKLLTLEQAVQKMTAQPASILGVEDRGLLQPGSFADVAIFDPDVFADCETAFEPNRPAVGMRYVLVNGTRAFENGALTDMHGGRVLRHD